MILKFHLIHLIPSNNCINLQGSIPGKQIFSQIFSQQIFSQEFYSTRYEKIIILDDFNIELENKVMKDFLEEHTFYNMMRQNTCFKGDGGSCIDFLIRNSKF